MSYYEDDYYWNQKSYGSANKHAPKGVHIMNKAEAKVCRKLMAETGLTEEELREHKKYRVMLSEAQTAGSKEKDFFGNVARAKKRLMKQATKHTGLAKEHPETISYYNQLVKARSGFGGWLTKYF